MKIDRFYPTDYMPEDPGRRKRVEPEEQEILQSLEATDISDEEINIVEELNADNENIAIDASQNNCDELKNKYETITNLILKLTEIDEQIDKIND